VILQPVGHDEVRAMLRALAEKNAHAGGAALHHAWLFAGPGGVGKFRVARWWASLLKCPQIGACGGACESCRLVAQAVHPDVFETGPAPKEKNAVLEADKEIERKKSVGIEQSRELISRLALKPTRPGPRIAIMREAGTMTPEAQNALLKLLEEPPGSAVIMLVTDNVGAMLQTVRSRCRHLAFGALSEDEVAEALERLPDPERNPRDAAAVSGGSVARALELDLEEREALLLAWENRGRDAGALEELAQQMMSRKDEGYALPALLEWQRVKIATSLGRRAGREPSDALAGILARLLDEAGGKPVGRLVEESSRIQRAMGLLARNANARVVIRDLLVNVKN
jgi:DNA polymerase-3 subunit delta'